LLIESATSWLGASSINHHNSTITNQSTIKDPEINNARLEFVIPLRRRVVVIGDLHVVPRTDMDDAGVVDQDVDAAVVSEYILRRDAIQSSDGLILLIWTQIDGPAPRAANASA
jgi:hypothetical protein